MWGNTVFGVCLIALFVSACFAADYPVNPISGDDSTCTPCKTISGALSRAQSGDSVTLSPGVHAITSRINGTTGGITITSSGGAQSTNITCGNGAFTALWLNDTMTFQGVTVTNCIDFIFSTASLSFSNVNFYNNDAGTIGTTVGATGDVPVTMDNINAGENSGVFFIGGGDLTLTNSHFSSHTGQLFREVGLATANKPVTTVSDSVFENIHGNAFQTLDLKANFHNCVFRNVYGADTVFYLELTTVVFTNCSFDSNSVNNSCPVLYAEQSSNVTFIDSEVFGSDCYGQGPICTDGGYLQVINSDFHDNINHLGDGGVMWLGGSTLSISGSRFYNNFANNTGGAFFADGATVTVTNSQFYGNYALLGGAILSDTGTTLLITHSQIFNNTADSTAGIAAFDKTTIIETQFYNNLAQHDSNDLTMVSIPVAKLTNVTIYYCNNNAFTESIMAASQIQFENFLFTIKTGDTLEQLKFSSALMYSCEFPKGNLDICFPGLTVVTTDKHPCGGEPYDYVSEDGYTGGSVCAQALTSIDVPLSCLDLSACYFDNGQCLPGTTCTPSADNTAAICAGPCPLGYPGGGCTGPNLYGIAPQTTPTLGGTIYLIGWNFGKTDGSDVNNITLGGQPCTDIVFHDSDFVISTFGLGGGAVALSCEVGAGTGGRIDVVITIDGLSTVPGNRLFSRTWPTVESYRPNYSTLSLTIMGNNFGDDASLVSVDIGTISWEVSSVTNTKIICVDQGVKNMTTSKRGTTVGTITVDGQQSANYVFDIDAFLLSTSGETSGGGIPTSGKNKKISSGGLAAAIVVPIVVVGAVIAGVIIYKSKQKSKERAYRQEADSFDGSEMR